VGYGPDDYDEVYETASKSERARLLRNGWVLLDERIASVGGVADEHRGKTVTRAAFSSEVGHGFGMGVAQQQPVQRQPAPEPSQTVTTYVLGWPKGRQTATEDTGFTEPPHD
jgi:hypothetical protein